MPEMYINSTLHLAIHRPWSSTHLFKFFLCNVIGASVMIGLNE